MALCLSEFWMWYGSCNLSISLNSRPLNLVSALLYQCKITLVFGYVDLKQTGIFWSTILPYGKDINFQTLHTNNLPISRTLLTEAWDTLYLIERSCSWNPWRSRHINMKIWSIRLRDMLSSFKRVILIPSKLDECLCIWVQRITIFAVGCKAVKTLTSVNLV